ncbi:MAG TPA: hypothetical protein VF050_13160 [Moraxellaceae bacterium]
MPNLRTTPAFIASALSLLWLWLGFQLFSVATVSGSNALGYLAAFTVLYGAASGTLTLYVLIKARSLGALLTSSLAAGNFVAWLAFLATQGFKPISVFWLLAIAFILFIHVVAILRIVPPTLSALPPR